MVGAVGTSRFTIWDTIPSTIVPIHSAGASVAAVGGEYAVTGASRNARFLDVLTSAPKIMSFVCPVAKEERR